MKFVFLLATIILPGLALAMPADVYARHWGHQASTTAVAVQAAATTSAGQRGGDKHNHDGDKGTNRNGNQVGNSPLGSTTKSVASTTVRAGGVPPAVASPAAATTTTTNRQAAAAATTTSANIAQNAQVGRIDPALVPDFGQQAGLQPDGTGNCKSDAGKTIPCQCPPNRAAFIAKLNEFVTAGSFFGRLAAPFPTGNNNKDALTRINTIISTLQNFAGKPGVGCPSVSAPNFSVVQQKLIKGG